MSHKETCIKHCKDYLQQLQLSQYYTEQQFNHVYRKQNGAQGNAFTVGLNAADFIINNSKFYSNDERNNESQA
jgi:hypothetical protein